MTQGTPETPENLGADAKLKASIAIWKRRLLDLTRRNRALNFRPSPVATVTIVDEQPAQVFRQICLQNRAMRFKAAPERTEGETAPTHPAKAEENAGTGLEFAPYDPAELDDRHTDDFLQTTARAENLDRSLRRLDEQARLALDEQGVNTLFLALGFLHHKEDPKSDLIWKAPLVLVPAVLERKSARTGYSIRLGDEDPLVNPALREYCSRNFAVELPELPLADQTPADYDLQDFLTETRRAIPESLDWSIKTDIVLALFSFQKLVMYKDLELNEAAFLEHGLIQRLVVRRAAGTIGLPPEIRSMDLDADFAPESSHHVVDADSSQLRALAAVAHGHDVVIEGPPGTGKSQTITNLIAQALAADKSVLFVAEKMAALNVVHTRLGQAGFGEFCLELHSTKVNKRSVMASLREALDASLQDVAAPSEAGRRLPEVRGRLTDYVHAVHQTEEPLGLSPFRAFGELGKLLGEARVSWEGHMDALRWVDVQQAARDLDDLSLQAKHVGPVAAHPWREASKRFYSPGDLEVIERALGQARTAVDSVVRHALEVERGWGTPPIALSADFERTGEVLKMLAASPGVSPSVIEGMEWDVAPARALDWAARGAELSRAKQEAAERFVPEALDRDHEDDVAYVERKSEGVLSFLAFLDGRYRAIRRRWRTYFRTDPPEALLDQAEEIRRIDRLRQQRRELAAADAECRGLFGEHWRGEDSNWTLLSRYIQWVVDFRRLARTANLGPAAFAAASRPDPTRSPLEDLRQLETAGEAARAALDALAEAVGWPSRYFEASPFKEIIERLRSLEKRLSDGPSWAAFESARQTAAAGPGAFLAAMAVSGEIPAEGLSQVFQRSFLVEWLSRVVKRRPALERFNSMTHEQRVEEFQKLDQAVLHENRVGLVRDLRRRTQDKLQRTEEAQALPALRRELARQRNLAPLRRTLHEAEAAIRAIKPCFLMSPLTVAQLLPGAKPVFDLVVFDEASQLCPEDAVGTIVRGRQIVVVGDPKQLPPTDFFSSGGADLVSEDADGEPLYVDAESVLEDMMSSGAPMSRLKWHYRSAHESLIAFSNTSFYDADMFTFPSVETGRASGGVSFELVEDGVYEGKGQNPIEAGRVADEVVRFAREQLQRREQGLETYSLGVGTFGLRQQTLVLDEVEARRRRNPDIEPFFDRGLPEPFFVKNLENVQGDERDVILLSITYGKSPDGKLRHNFGPINGQNGWRRLNVLITRARARMRVISSMRGDEISLAAAASPGPKLLRDFLLYAERGGLETAVESGLPGAESLFERDVVQELNRHGIAVERRVGVAGYRIDIGVLDEEIPGRYVCGIECDGEMYRASETARDRDRLRQQVLEGRGWTLLRVWSTDWFKDRTRQIERLVSRIEEARTAARSEAQAEREERVRAAEEAEQRAAEENAAEPIAYVRPEPAAYAFAPGESAYAGAELANEPDARIEAAVRSVVATESPVHLADLTLRIGGVWSSRVGSRAQARIDEAVETLIKKRTIEKRGDFLWTPNQPCVVRSRAGTRIPANRIADEEYDLAILSVLEKGHRFIRPELVREVRAILGYSRTGPAIEDAVTASLERLTAAGRLGEGGTGVALRMAAHQG